MAACHRGRTHALYQVCCVYNLGLAVVDEQHRLACDSDYTWRKMSMLGYNRNANSEKPCHDRLCDLDHPP